MNHIEAQAGAGRLRQVGILVGATLGWGGGVAMFVLLGGLFIAPLEAAFLWRRGDIALSSFILLGMGLMAPLIGVAADRIGAHIFVGVGAIGFACAYVALATMNGELWRYLAILGFVALIAAPATSPLIYSRVVVAHFTKTRGLALSICLSGSTALAALMLPLTQYVIASFGWRAGYYMLAGLALMIGAISFVLLRKAAPPRQTEASSGASRWGALARALGDARFWLLALCFASGGCALVGVSAHTQPFLTESGFDPMRAAWLGSLLGVVMIVARVTVGALLDVMEPGWLGLTAFLAAVLGCLGLAWPQAPALAIIVALALIACAQSAESDFLGFFTARYFGVAHFGVISGALSLIFAVFVALGGVIAGRMHDTFGDYRAFFYLAAILCSLAGVALFASARLKAPEVRNSGQ